MVQGEGLRARRERFLARMEAVRPRARLLAVIGPHYPKGERARPPLGLERMLRVYFLHQWYGLADEAIEDALYDSQALRSFARIDLSAEGVPDAATLLKFRRLLEKRVEIVALERQIDWQIAGKRGLIKAMTEGAEKQARQAVEKAKAAVRAFVEHRFHLVKKIFRHRKVRYRGLAKNGHQLDTLFGLANVVIGARARVAA